VLLLNAVLTVREGEPNSHSGKGWERFTDAVIRAVAAREETVAFVLWGAPAGKKAALVGPPPLRCTAPRIPVRSRRSGVSSGAGPSPR
jgi:uracil DNA glycosylase